MLEWFIRNPFGRVTKLDIDGAKVIELIILLDNIVLNLVKFFLKQNKKVYMFSLKIPPRLTSYIKLAYNLHKLQKRFKSNKKT